MQNYGPLIASRLRACLLTTTTHLFVVTVSDRNAVAFRVACISVVADVLLAVDALVFSLAIPFATLILGAPLLIVVRYGCKRK